MELKVSFEATRMVETDTQPLKGKSSSCSNEGSVGSASVTTGSGSTVTDDDDFTDEMPTIGVLALQGAFREHIELFKSIGGVRVREVRLPEELEKVNGLVIPGGESTAISSLAERWGMTKPLQQWVQSGKPTWGTCAGMILLSERVTGKMKKGQVVLGGLNATVHRNYFGSQLGSFIGELDVNANILKSTTPYKGVFIRAPVIVEHSDDTDVLATVTVPSVGSNACANGDQEKNVVVAVQQKNIMATAFHPELTKDTRWHEAFKRMVLEYTRT